MNSSYKVHYQNPDTQKLKVVKVKATGVINAVDTAIIKHLDLLGWEIIKVEKYNAE